MVSGCKIKQWWNITSWPPHSLKKTWNSNLLLRSSQIFLPPGKSLKTIKLADNLPAPLPKWKWNVTCPTGNFYLDDWTALFSSPAPTGNSHQFIEIMGKKSIFKSKVFLTLVNKNVTASWGSIHWIKAPLLKLHIINSLKISEEENKGKKVVIELKFSWPKSVNKRIKVNFF